MLLMKSLSVLVTVAVVVEGSGQISWLPTLLEFLEKSKHNEVVTQGSSPRFIKCDKTFFCPDGFTCCKMSLGFHCCPPRWTCSTTPPSCDPPTTPLLARASVEVQPNFNKERIDYTGPTGKESAPKDVLQPTLEDRHPKGGEMTDVPQDRDGLASFVYNDAATLQYTTQDEAGVCPPPQTACRSPIGLRCCPWPHASCCMNGLHCCRAGSRCVNKLCISSSFATSSTSETGATSSAAFFFNQQGRVGTRPGSKARSGFLAAKRAGPGFGTGTQSGASSTSDGLVPCDASASCTDEQTCCKLASGDWGCCPYPNATCCQDGSHCCPNGYMCDQSKRSCSKNEVVLDWSLKLHAVKKEP